MGKFCESTYEEAFIDLLEQNGWEYTCGDDLHRKLDETIIEDELLAWVTDGEARGVVAFTRGGGGRCAFVAANLTDRPVAFTPSGVAFDPGRKPILASRFSTARASTPVPGATSLSNFPRDPLDLITQKETQECPSILSAGSTPLTVLGYGGPRCERYLRNEN